MGIITGFCAHQCFYHPIVATYLSALIAFNSVQIIRLVGLLALHKTMQMSNELRNQKRGQGQPFFAQGGVVARNWTCTTRREKAAAGTISVAVILRAFSSL